MKKFLMSKKGIVLLATMIAVVASAVGAYAYFTTTGDGTGSATVGTSSLFDVSSSPATGNALVPTALGDPNAEIDTIAYAIKNMQEGNQHLSQVTVKVDPAYTNGSPACTAADFSINGAAAGATVTLPKNNNLLSLSDAPANEYDSSITIQMVENGANQDSCQNESIPLLFHAS
jgi:hypothetical protein